LALLLDPGLHQTATNRIRSTCQKYGFTGTPYAAGRLHLSLLGFGEHHEELAAAVSQVAATIRFPPFEVRLDKALSFRHHPPRCPFVLTSEQGVNEVRVFFQVLHKRFYGDVPGSTKSSAFIPHLTLLWDQKMIPSHALERPLSWTAHDFVLVRSYQGESRYDILGRWPLLADEAPKG
jgi:2'-5' RNA ligase